MEEGNAPVWELSKFWMYLISYFEKAGMVEASLGGKVTVGEAEVFGEELLEIVASLEGRPFNLLIDYSRARGVDQTLLQMLVEINDLCHELGAQKIASAVPSDQVVEHQTSRRLNHVLEGREEFVLDASYAQFVPVSSPAALSRAA